MKREFALTLDGTTYQVVINGNSVLVNGQPFVVGLDGARVLVDGAPFEVTLRGEQALVDGIAYNVSVEGGVESKAARTAARVASAGAVTAIMPGKIIRLLVSKGDEVQEGQVVCILEAMKMENELKAPKSGRIKSLSVQPGQNVEKGAVLAEIE